MTIEVPSYDDVDRRDRSGHADWSDASARALLQLLTESVAEMIGFEAAVLCVALGEDLVTIGYHGPEAMREFIFATDPVSVLDPVIEQAETWGRFSFLATEDRRGDWPGHWVALSTPHPAGGPDAWQPDDVLIAILRDDRGRLLGSLSVDAPISGRRPDLSQRALLERYAEQVERAVVAAFDRHALAVQAAHADAARRAVRSASAVDGGTFADVLDRVHRPLVEGLSADACWIHLIGPDQADAGVLRLRDGRDLERPLLLDVQGSHVARRLWRHQSVAVHGSGDAVTGRLLDESSTTALAVLLEATGGVATLVVPLGIGSECVGLLALTRGPDRPAWSAVERDVVLDLGHDLGAVFRTAQALERERTLVHELRLTDEYRSHMIATLSHELRTPLTIIRGNVEVLQDLGPGVDLTPFHAALFRSSQRMQHVVDDLLILTRVSDPRHPLVRVPVDLAFVVHDVVAMVDTAATAKGLRIEVRAPETPLLVPGDPAELDRLVGNLVSNAVKYSDDGATVTVEVSSHEDQVVLKVSDEGLGISRDDQARLFQAFFRSTNPEAHRRPGTGLGLSIVASIVTRHGGTIAVDSDLGRGTRITVALPRD